MSLVGSLEDLGLGDILQIITLSRKSGALLLRSDGGEGRVIFRDGLVCGARVKGRTPDLRQLVVGDGALGEADFESLVAEARGADAPLAPAVAECVGPERFERLRREFVERAVLDMFGWESGEFRFDDMGDSRCVRICSVDGECDHCCFEPPEIEIQICAPRPELCM